MINGYGLGRWLAKRREHAGLVRLGRCTGLRLEGRPAGPGRPDRGQPAAPVRVVFTVSAAPPGTRLQAVTRIQRRGEPG
jgi:hypothetical protein